MAAIYTIGSYVAPQIAFATASFCAAAYLTKKVRAAYKQYMQQEQKEGINSEPEIKKEKKTYLIQVSQTPTTLAGKIKQLFLNIYYWIKEKLGYEVGTKVVTDDLQGYLKEHYGIDIQETNLDETTSVQTPKHRLSAYDQFLREDSIAEDAFSEPNYTLTEGSVEEQRSSIINQAESLIETDPETGKETARNLLPQSELIDQIEFDMSKKAFRIQLKSKLKGKINSFKSDPALKGIGWTMQIALGRATLNTSSDTLKGRFVNNALVFEEKDLQLSVAGQKFDVTAIIPYEKDEKKSVCLAAKDSKGTETWIELPQAGFSYIFKHLSWQGA